jgi:type IV pilus assembly protein PilY1
MLVTPALRFAGLLALAVGLAPLAPTGLSAAQSPSPPLDAFGDDLFLLSTSVSPNVILLMDNSPSMQHIEWHPGFDPDLDFVADPMVYGCAAFDPNTVYTYMDDTNENHCGSGNRTIYSVGNSSDPALWDGRYLNWYFGLANNDPILDEIANAVAGTAGCNASGGSSGFEQKYRRTRFEASKHVMLDLLCVAESKNVRFGLAGMRDAADALNEDANGGYIIEDLGRSNPNHAAELESAIKNSTINSGGGTPLGETLFQIYTYWMSRDLADIPYSDQNGDLVPTQFPRYQYANDGDWETNSNKWLEDPMLYACEKAFVIVVSSGQPTRDDFDTEVDTDNATGYADFADLIGDYYVPLDPVTSLSIDPDSPEIPGDAVESAYYIDDIAKYMFENDFRPDFVGDQAIDTYTVGFATNAATASLLERTAEVGNGTAYSAKDGDELAASLIAALNDIIEKSASFTAATVPSARTQDGADFYQSFFFPRGKSAFWEGHIRSWKIDAIGDIKDKNDNCALDDLDPGECNSGQFKPEAEFFWDAANEVPLAGTSNAAGVRQLFVSKSPTAGALPPAFDLSLTAADFGLDVFAAAPDPAPNSPLYAIAGSQATTEEGLADEIAAYVRGCFFGTGPSLNVATPVPCISRPFRLADIFHSNPVVVRRPLRQNSEPSYQAFKSHYSDRTRVIYAGTNGGFLEGIHAGTYDNVTETYDAGTGAELFGFMPWEARTKIKNFPIDPATNRTHYVDGDVTASDVWLYSNATTAAKVADGREWHTVLVGSLREGGNHYYALDVTNPDGSTGAGGSATLPYPAYLWEFPSEADPGSDFANFGETWARPVVSKIKVQVGADDNGGAGYERYVAVLVGGYDAESDPNPTPVTGVASSYDATATRGRGIYLIDIKTGGVIAEKKFDAAALDATADMTYPLVGTPAVFDLDFDGYTDVIYVVDMGGQVFKWVINEIGEDRINDASALRTQPNWPFKRFFTADIEPIGGDNYSKNLFFPPAGAFVGGKLWLAFGSGERRSLAFQGIANEDENNRFYVVQDPDPFEKALVPIATMDETNLQDITGDEDGAAITGMGYFFKAADGEKFVTNVEIFSNHVIAATFTPSASSADPCISRGSGTLYIFDITNGAGFFTDGSNNPTRGVSIGAGLPTDPKVSVGVGGEDNRVIIEKSGADLESIEEQDIDTTGGIIYWRER